MAACVQTLLKAHGGFAKLLPHLSSHNKLTVLPSHTFACRPRAASYLLSGSSVRQVAYALGAVQNTCMDFEYVGVMQQSGAVARLQESRGFKSQLHPSHISTPSPHIPTHVSSTPSPIPSPIPIPP